MSEESDYYDDFYDGGDDAAEEAPTEEPLEEASTSDIDIIDTDNCVSVKAHERIIITGDDRITTSKMSMFEITELISIRGEHISKFADCYVSINGLSDPMDMAKRELMARKCPLVIHRHIGDMTVNGELQLYYELWYPNEMQFPVVYDV
jgi:DNA-directed RNA polymerases I, II, and III subunit RPABC2